MVNIAIIGLDTYFGTCRTLRGFERAVYTGLRCEATTDALRGIEVVLRVANNALFDAKVQRDDAIGVWWVGQTPSAVRIAGLWNFAGPAIDIPASGDAVFRALVDARAHLLAGNIMAALVGENCDAGAGALVLTCNDAMVMRTYARLGSSASTPSEVGYLELMQLPSMPNNEGHSEKILDEKNAFKFGQSIEPTCALGSAASNLIAPTAIGSLIKATLCLHHRTIPTTPDWRGPAGSEQWRDTSCYVAPQSRPWFLEPGKTQRYAGVSLTQRRENCSASSASTLANQSIDILLSEVPAYSDNQTVNHYLLKRPFYLFPIAADGHDALIAQVEVLQQQLENGANLDELAAQTFATYQSNADAAYTLSLVGHNHAEVLHEISFAVRGVDKAFTQGRDWTSPLGSYFTADPLGQQGHVTFVYPGAFNAYVGMGRDLFQLFPYLHARFAEVTQYAGRATADKLLYPRSPFTQDEAAARLHANPTAMIEAGASFAILYTAVMREIFGVQPHAALGYSLGEISMLWALGVWRDGDAGSNAWNNTTLFKTRLFGPKDAVREHWGLGANESDDFWQSYLLKAPVDKVQQALAEEPRVYLTIINEMKEVVIAGHPANCQRVIERLDCHALPVPFDAVIHNPATRSEYAAFVDLYTLPVGNVPGIAFYSAAGYAPLTLERDALAHAMAEMTCNPVDFPRLVGTAYNEGARIFVELGPLGTCSRWIDHILHGQPHAVVPINKSGKGDYEGVLSVLAMLLSHRIAVDISTLYENQKSKVKSQKSKSQFSILSPQFSILSPQSSSLPPQSLVLNTLSEGHIAFLKARRTALQQTAELIAMQTEAAEQMMLEAGGKNQKPRAKNQAVHHVSRFSSPLFDKEQLHEFATGDVTACFGPAYAHYRGQRIPRLPNGDLTLVSRVLHVDGTPGKVEVGASLLSEYDVPSNAWFYRDHAALPTSVLMEIALQPCGVLSTYLGSILPYPDVDFYFRNLDGEAELLRDVDARGKTIANHTRLLSSDTLPGIMLQKFAFELSCDGVPFCRVTSSFGYFAPEAMQRQAGLDNGTARQPWLSTNFDGNPKPTLSVQSVELKRTHQLDLLDKARIVPDGGEYGRGYVYAEVPVSPDDWFFACHFYEDPVMPGSLGVEAMVQALHTYAARQGLARHPRAPHPASSSWPAVMRESYSRQKPRLRWKYRGQVPPERDRLRLEVHVSDVQITPDTVTLTGDGSLWKGNLRIYEVKGIKIWE